MLCVVCCVLHVVVRCVTVHCFAFCEKNLTHKNCMTTGLLLYGVEKQGPKLLQSAAIAPVLAKTQPIEASGGDVRME